MKNHLQNVVEKVFLNHFLKNQNWAYLWINILKCSTVCFYWMRVESYRKILKLSCRPLAFTSYKAFLKKRPAFFLPHFLYDFWRKMFFLLYSIFLVLLREILVKMCINCLLTRLWRHINFEINLIFPIKPFYLTK